VSPDAILLVKGLLVKERSRLGASKGIAEIETHAFYHSLKWDLLGHSKVSIPVSDTDVNK
jgi:hypothetical protein